MPVCRLFGCVRLTAGRQGSCPGTQGPSDGRVAVPTRRMRQALPQHMSAQATCPPAHRREAIPVFLPGKRQMTRTHACSLCVGVVLPPCAVVRRRRSTVALCYRVVVLGVAAIYHSNAGFIHRYAWCSGVWCSACLLFVFPGDLFSEDAMQQLIAHTQL